MSAIDKILAALARNRMDCLVLEPGRRPAMRRAGEDIEVTRTLLDGPAIDRILAEVAPPDQAADAQTDDRWEFDYAFDGLVFRFFGLRGPQGWLVSVTHDRDAVAPPPPPPSPAPEPPAAEEPPPEPVFATETDLDAIDIPDLPTLLAEMVERGASDLHLSSLQPPRLRVDGDLDVIAGYRSPSPDRLERLLFEITPKDKRDQLEATNSLRAVISQVLLKRVGGGRVAAFEIPSAMQTGRRLGMALLDDALFALVEKQLVHPEEAYRRANNRDEFANRLSAARIDVDFLAEAPGEPAAS